MQNDFQNIVRSLWLKLKLTGSMDSKIKLTKSPQIFYPFFFPRPFCMRKYIGKFIEKIRSYLVIYFVFLFLKRKEKKKKTNFWCFQNEKHIWLEEKKKNSKIKNRNFFGNSFWKSWNFILCEVIITFCLFIICFKVFN